jgi:hypothetical protein
VADQDLGAQHATEPLRLLSQHCGSPAALADRAFPIPHQHPRHRPKPGEELPPTGEQVLRRSRGQQPRTQPAGIAGHHDQHRQPRRRAGLAEPDRQRDGWEPQITLGHLPSRIQGARGRVRRQIHRPQLPDPILEHRQRPGPADPLGDHRGRHRRPRLEQLSDARLDRIHDRPATHPPLIPRRPISGQRPLHGVLRDPHHPRDRLDRHPLSPVQPADLGPILHAQHLAPSPARLEPGSARGQLSSVVWGSVFTRRRQVREASGRHRHPPGNRGVAPEVLPLAVSVR